MVFLDSPPPRFYILGEKKFGRHFLSCFNWKSTHPGIYIPPKKQKNPQFTKICPHKFTWLHSILLTEKFLLYYWSWGRQTVWYGLSITNNNGNSSDIMCSLKLVGVHNLNANLYEIINTHKYLYFSVSVPAITLCIDYVLYILKNLKLKQADFFFFCWKTTRAKLFIF